MLRRAAALAVILLVGCDTDDGRQLREPTSEQRAAMTTTTSTTTTVAGTDLIGGATVAPSVATTVAPKVPPFALTAPWAEGGPIDARFTCDGEDRSPTLSWTAPPPGSVDLALVVTDDDAAGFVHWAVAAIAPTAGEVGEGGQITGALEGTTGFGTPGWGGPCPPEPGVAHTYRFSLYALQQQVELPDGFTGEELIDLVNATAIGVAELTGTYTRAP